MDISEVGEKKVIEIISSNTTYPKFMINKVSLSDAEIIDLGMSNEYLAITMDTIDEGIDIFPEMTPYQIGWTVVNVNFSDLAAVGAKPLCILSSWGVPKNLDLSAIEKIAQGINDAARHHGAYVIGGDLNQSGKLYFSGCAVGIVKKNKQLTRCGAKNGDSIFVTGKIGGANAGYLSLVHDLSISNSIKSIIKNKLFQPTARVDFGNFLAKIDCVTSCIDISDGLIASVLEIAKGSKVGIELDNYSIPYLEEAIKVTDKLNVDNYMLGMWGGGDYELLFTVKKNKKEQFLQECKKENLECFYIGDVKPNIDGCNLILGKKTIPLESGFEHFKNQIP